MNESQHPDVVAAHTAIRKARADAQATMMLAQFMELERRRVWISLLALSWIAFFEMRKARIALDDATVAFKEACRTERNFVGGKE